MFAVPCSFYLSPYPATIPVPHECTSPLVSSLQLFEHFSSPSSFQDRHVSSYLPILFQASSNKLEIKTPVGIDYQLFSQSRFHFYTCVYIIIKLSTSSSRGALLYDQRGTDGRVTPESSPMSNVF